MFIVEVEYKFLEGPYICSGTISVQGQDIYKVSEKAKEQAYKLGAKEASVSNVRILN